MKTPRLPAILVAAALAAACAEADDDAVELETPEADVPTLEDPAPSSSAAALAVDSLDGGRTYLTDTRGHALYLLRDQAEGGATCDAACEARWPPLVTDGAEPAAPPATLDAELVGTVERPDGTLHLTYGGHRLYHYVEDRGPGDVRGQDVHDAWGEWYLVGPDGRPVTEAGPGAE